MMVERMTRREDTMKVHTSKSGGETGWTRNPACAPAGSVFGASHACGRRYFVTADRSLVTCAKCRRIQDRRDGIDGRPEFEPLVGVDGM
jgi:hypothetical protein